MSSNNFFTSAPYSGPAESNPIIWNTRWLFGLSSGKFPGIGQTDDVVLNIWHPFYLSITPFVAYLNLDIQLQLRAYQKYLSILINFYFLWIHQKSHGFLTIAGRKEVKFAQIHESLEPKFGVNPLLLNLNI